MLRTLLVGILAVTAAAACSSKSDAPVVTPGMTAGKVVELNGTVTATRGTEKRALAAGAEISADDVIDTAAESRVVILLAHNNARWDLGPNKHGKVADSLAWTAAKVDRPAGAVTEETSTAGRHAEKNAATTATTTGEAAEKEREEDSAPATAMAMPSDEDRAAAQGAAKTATTSEPRADRAPTEPPADKRKSPPPRPPAQVASRDEPRRMDDSTDRNAVPPKATMRRAPEATKPMNTESLGIIGGNAGDGMGTPKTGGSAGPSLAPSTRPADAVDALKREIRQGFARDRAAMRACFDSTAPSILIEITVTKGVYAVKTTDAAVTPAARACLTKIVSGMGSTRKLDQPVSVKFTLAK